MSSSNQLQIHIRNPHISSEGIREMGLIPFSVRLCFPWSKIQNYLIYFKLLPESIPFKIAWSQKSPKDNTKVPFKLTLNVNHIKSLCHNPTQRARDEGKGHKACKHKHRMVPHGPHPSFTAPLPPCAA